MTMYNETRTCFSCEGSGKYDDNTICPVCEGTGTVGLTECFCHAYEPSECACGAEWEDNDYETI